MVYYVNFGALLTIKNDNNMKSSIKITRGKHGYFLTVNQFHIKRGWTNEIIATKTDYEPNNWISSEWVSITELRKFWNNYRLIILSKCQF